MRQPVTGATPHTRAPWSPGVRAWEQLASAALPVSYDAGKASSCLLHFLPRCLGHTYLLDGGVPGFRVDLMQSPPWGDGEAGVTAGHRGAA